MWKALSDEEKKPYQVYIPFTDVHSIRCHFTLHHTIHHKLRDMHVTCMCFAYTHRQLCMQEYAVAHAKHYH